MCRVCEDHRARRVNRVRREIVVKSASRVFRDRPAHPACSDRRETKVCRVYRAPLASQELAVRRVTRVTLDRKDHPESQEQRRRRARRVSQVYQDCAETMDFRGSRDRRDRRETLAYPGTVVQVLRAKRVTLD